MRAKRYQKKIGINLKFRTFCANFICYSCFQAFDFFTHFSEPTPILRVREMDF